MKGLVLGLSALALTLAALGVALSPHFYASNLSSVFSAVVAERGIAVERDISYGPHPRHRLDVYRSRGPGDGAVILFFYGGGWRMGERTTYGFVGAALAARGFTTVVADYRLYPEAGFPEFVEDGARAYRWVAESLAPGRPVILMGHSAGAHIAALLALDAHYLNGEQGHAPPPAGLIGLSGPYAFDPTTWATTRDIFANAGRADAARPVAFVTPKAPPALLMHGLSDTTVKLWNLRTLAAGMKKAGVRVRALELDGIGHIGILTALARPLRWRAPVLDEIVAFARFTGRK